MLIKKSETREHKNSPSCTVWEHDHPTDNLSLATTLIDGRYPEEKRVTNTECEEIVYVIGGSGVIHSDKGDFEIKEGDSYSFKKNEKYYIDGNKLFLTLINAPKWTFEQYKEVE